jgi:hypothetical protein
MGVKHIETFCDSLLVVQQVVDIYQCFDWSLNAYLDKCQKIIDLFDDFTMQHVIKDENTVMNDLAQQASGFWSNRRKLYVLEKLDVTIWQTGWSGFCPIQSAEIYSAKPSSAKPNGLVQKPEDPEFPEVWMI